jgi:hypothetical protein
MTAARRRPIAVDVQAAFAVSQRRACRALGLARSALRYDPARRDGSAALARRIDELAGAHPRFGYRRIWALLRREGWPVNKKAVHRLWRRAGLKWLGHGPSHGPGRRTARTVTAATSGRRAARTTSGHGTSPSTVPPTAGP